MPKDTYTTLETAADYIAADLLPSCPRARWNVLGDVIWACDGLKFSRAALAGVGSKQATLFSQVCKQVPSRCKVRENWLYMHEFIASFFPEGGETDLATFPIERLEEDFLRIQKIAEPLREQARSEMRAAA